MGLEGARHGLTNPPATTGDDNVAAKVTETEEVTGNATHVGGTVAITRRKTEAKIEDPPQDDDSVAMVPTLDVIYGTETVLNAGARQAGIAIGTAGARQSLVDPGTRTGTRWQHGPHGWAPADGHRLRGSIITGSTTSCTVVLGRQ